MLLFLRNMTDEAISSTAREGSKYRGVHEHVNWLAFVVIVVVVIVMLWLLLHLNYCYVVVIFMLLLLMLLLLFLVAVSRFMDVNNRNMRVIESTKIAH